MIRHMSRHFVYVAKWFFGLINENYISVWACDAIVCDTAAVTLSQMQESVDNSKTWTMKQWIYI